MNLKFISVLSLLLISLPINAQDGWFWQNPLPQGNNIYDIIFLNKDTVLATMEGGFLYQSTNRGLSWTTQDLGVNENLLSMYYLTEDLGWITTNGGSILNTTDGGLHWDRNQIGISYEHISDIYFINEYLGWAASSQGKVYKTIDGGLNWNGVNVGFNPINKICFVNKDTGWAASNFYFFTNLKKKRVFYKNYNERRKRAFLLRFYEPSGKFS